MEQMIKPLTLVVINSEQLDAGVTPQFTCNHSGAVIGSSRYADWWLKDQQMTIGERHCELVEIDNYVCLRDLSGFTYINSASMPVGKGRLARLQHNDEIRIGRYRIRAILDHSYINENSDSQLDGLLSFSHDSLIDTGFEDIVVGIESEPVSSDPIAMLDDVVGPETKVDLISEPDRSKDDARVSNYLLSQNSDTTYAEMFAENFDRGSEISSSIYLTKTASSVHKAVNHTSTETGKDMPHHKHFQTPSFDINNEALKGPEMDENELSFVEDEVTKALSQQESEEGRSRHLLAGPILEGLGAHISDSHDMKRMHFLSQEFGLSLQACIKGILEINQQVNTSRSGSMNRKLQPIEDNPLRLGLNYEQTIGTMYDKDKSLVHLSAPAAISESLKSVCDHNDAVQYATSEALRQILKAFSPQVLMRRFYSYKRNTDVETQSEQAWAWEMYCSYYQELISDRQSGFEKLFWEIFEQSYDGKIREKQQEL